MSFNGIGGITSAGVLGAKAIASAIKAKQIEKEALASGATQSEANDLSKSVFLEADLFGTANRENLKDSLKKGVNKFILIMVIIAVIVGLIAVMKYIPKDAFKRDKK